MGDAALDLEPERWTLPGFPEVHSMELIIILVNGNVYCRTCQSYRCTASLDFLSHGEMELSRNQEPKIKGFVLFFLPLPKTVLSNL